MENTQVILNLPSDLVERAKSAGVLENEQMAQLIEAELERKEVSASLKADLAKLRAAAEPLTDDQVMTLVNSEIKAYRAEKRQ